MTAALLARLADSAARPVAPAVAALACQLAQEAGALAVLFYGSNLRSGTLEGVLDFYLLMPGPPERGLWPRVSYREVEGPDGVLRAKIATMSLSMFSRAARGQTIDTTIWARFVQPCALVWVRDAAVRAQVLAALGEAAITAGRLAALVGPPQGPERAFWEALFRATYRAELRVEKPGREASILDAHAAHFDGLLPLAWQAGGISFEASGTILAPLADPARARASARWWQRRRRLGKVLNLLRLARASGTFDGAARYAAWKIERHSGVRTPLSPMQERHPLLAAPALARALWRARRQARGAKI